MRAPMMAIATQVKVQTMMIVTSFWLTMTKVLMVSTLNFQEEEEEGMHDRKTSIEDTESHVELSANTGHSVPPTCSFQFELSNEQQC